MIRTHESLLQLIREYGAACIDEGQQVPELLAEIDRALFDLYDTLDRARIVAAIGESEGCGCCADLLTDILVEHKPSEPKERP